MDPSEHGDAESDLNRIITLAPTDGRSINLYYHYLWTKLKTHRSRRTPTKGRFTSFHNFLSRNKSKTRFPSPTILATFWCGVGILYVRTQCVPWSCSPPPRFPACLQAPPPPFPAEQSGE